MKRLTDGQPGSERAADPAPPLAERLEDAAVGTLVYVDQHGQVRSPTTFRTMNRLRLGGLAALLGASTWFYWVVGGPAGLAVGGGVTLLAIRQIANWRRMQRGIALLAADRLDEAEALLLPQARGLFQPVGLKARANQNLARIAALRGRHEEALALQEVALRQYPKDPRARTERRTLEYGRVVTLVNLDRVGDARARFDAIERAMEGDYLRVQRAVAELYLAFGEGEHQFEPDYLREQAEIALAIPSARALLGLLAWARKRARNHAEAARLLALARDRPGEIYVRRLCPKLAAWMDEQGG